MSAVYFLSGIFVLCTILIVIAAVLQIYWWTVENIEEHKESEKMQEFWEAMDAWEDDHR